MKLSIEVAEAIRDELERVPGANSGHFPGPGALPGEVMKAEVSRALSIRADLTGPGRKKIEEDLATAVREYDQYISSFYKMAQTERANKKEQSHAALLEKRRKIREALSLELEAVRHDSAYDLLLELRATGEWSRELGRLERFLHRQVYTYYTDSDAWGWFFFFTPFFAACLVFNNGCVWLLLGSSAVFVVTPFREIAVFRWSFVPLFFRAMVSVVAASLVVLLYIGLMILAFQALKEQL